MSRPGPVGVATLGAGCFWGVETLFQYLPGVLSTRVGYAGGATSRPTYADVCTGRTGHAEVVQIDYDPGRITYRELLERFWDSHDATRRRKAQYRSTVLTHSPAQDGIAHAMKAELERTYGRALLTEIVPLRRFYLAEEHHQRYLERRGLVTVA